MRIKMRKYDFMVREIDRLVRREKELLDILQERTRKMNENARTIESIRKLL